MANETKKIPLLVALEFMSRVNNLLNSLIREEKFPAILYAKYDRTFNDLLKMAQIMNYKFKDVANKGMEDEARKFMSNLDKWEDEYCIALRTQSNSSLGLTTIDENLPIKRAIEMPTEDLIKSPKDLKHIEANVKEILGKDLFDECLGRIESKSREAALSKIMEDMVEKGDIDDEVAN